MNIGMKIQKGGGRYIKDEVSFILFDVKIDKWWLRRPDIEEIAGDLANQGSSSDWLYDIRGSD